ncbi:conserved hypothetical protein [Burkholderia sp. 8Y]|uniref:hypothetical protein n=1 Tax=Burkholderia sp. 8Y TaxID=2653133 RepID=UPI0012F03FF1|nr:hypothetical protein [Burkholderia sp. 8Y]VXB24470.1 conserved hypothetical protein [Burkholderia sp. 8Y]
MSAAPCSIEPTISRHAEANAIVDKLEAFIGNFRFLSAEARAHIAQQFDDLRSYLPQD